MCEEEREPCLVESESKDNEIKVNSVEQNVEEICVDSSDEGKVECVDSVCKTLDDDSLNDEQKNEHVTRKKHDLQLLTIDVCRNRLARFEKTVMNDTGTSLPNAYNRSAFAGLLLSIREVPTFQAYYKIVLSLTPQPAANSDVVCDGYASTIVFNSSFVLQGWRKPKSRTVMPAGSGSGAARSPPHAHDAAAPADEDAHHNGKDKDAKKKSKNKEGMLPSVLIEGVLFRARYLGSTQLACEGQPTKATRMLQAEEAVSRIKGRLAGVVPQWGCSGPYSGVYAAPAAVFRLSFLGSVEVDEDSRRRKKRPKKNMVEEAVTKIKAPEGENQPSTEVDLFISTEKIMVLNTELKEIMMDHALRTISYIADIGDLVVLMARRRFVPHENDSDQPKLNRTPKMICHVFESEEAQFIAQSIGQAFQVAYMEFLKANGIEDHSFVKEMDYQEVLNSQEIFGDELQMFAKKELQKEVVVPKTKGEILGVVVVESGWGSMLPTVVIANLAPAGAAARCGQLNIGDQIIAINGVSLVGLPLSTCQTYIKNSKNQTVVKLTVVPCAPVVEVKIKRPDTKYQLGFSVQNGVSSDMDDLFGLRNSPFGLPAVIYLLSRAKKTQRNIWFDLPFLAGWLGEPLRFRDLQPAARRHRGARRRARGPPHHRDQLAERGGRAARAHRQPARHLRRRDINENDADINVPAPDGPRESGVHITTHKCLLATSATRSRSPAAVLTHTGVVYWKDSLPKVYSLDRNIAEFLDQFGDSDNCRFKLCRCLYQTSEWQHFQDLSSMSPDIQYICYFNDSKKICIPNYCNEATCEWINNDLSGPTMHPLQDKYGARLCRNAGRARAMWTTATSSH
ncbi:unnamed protein product [Diatraea saccharalis]|uniref:Protein lin-10 n=1 Tax=Diatraea saccharalis TaxID=40085 RepID=A0A9N9RIJ4_9NEOP|nr:unnamed protein product [Diatraea saccharalis]